MGRIRHGLLKTRLYYPTSFQRFPRFLGVSLLAITDSLQVFSQADTESKVKANIHEGIDSTILILKYRLKEKDFHPAI